MTAIAVSISLAACGVSSEIPFVLEDLRGTYLVDGVWSTLEAVDDSLLCTASGCVNQIAVGDFEDVSSAGVRLQCTVSVGGISLTLRANGTFRLDGTRRQDCVGPDPASATITREALTAVGLYRLQGDGSDRLTLLQSDGENGTYLLEGWVEGVESVTAAGQIIPRYLHFGVRDRSRLEFTTTWAH